MLDKMDKELYELLAMADKVTVINEETGEEKNVTAELQKHIAIELKKEKL